MHQRRRKGWRGALTNNEDNYRLAGPKSQLYQEQFGVYNTFCVITIYDLWPCYTGYKNIRNRLYIFYCKNPSNQSLSSRPLLLLITKPAASHPVSALPSSAPQAWRLSDFTLDSVQFSYSSPAARTALLYIKYRNYLICKSLYDSESRYSLIWHVKYLDRNVFVAVSAALSNTSLLKCICNHRETFYLHG